VTSPSSSSQEPFGIRQLAQRYNTDKAQLVDYLDHYDAHFGHLRDQDIRLLELGVNAGGSLQLWRDYFHRATIVGLDINPVEIDDQSGRIKLYTGKQQDEALLDRIGTESAPDGFDIIIDDCAHIGVLARASFWHLFEHHLKSGGVYVIEDWGTGYWDSWVDGVSYQPRKAGFSHGLYRVTRGIARLQRSTLGRLPLVNRFLRWVKVLSMRPEYHSHSHGMVGFIKELVDELRVTDSALGLPSFQSKFREINLYQSHLFVTKA
jgi:hypothetical protein